MAHVSHAIIVHAVDTHDIILVTHRALSFVWPRVGLFQVGLRVGQVTCSGRVSATDRAFLEMALQDVTSREGVPTKHTHVWSITSVCSLELGLRGKKFREGLTSE